MADLEAIRELLQQSRDGGTPFAEALVTANLVGDWELSRVVCEIFSLPFLPVDLAKPDPEALEGLDREFLADTALVPLWRFGQVLTVCMPGLVPADVLGMLAAESNLILLPVVGTVESNRRWVDDNYGESRKKKSKRAESSWTSIFDDADAAVLMDLEPDDPDAPAMEEVLEGDAIEGLEEDFDESLLTEDLEKELEEASALEFTSISAGLEGLDETKDAMKPPSMAEAKSDDEDPPPAGDLDLPPSPTFG